MKPNKKKEKEKERDKEKENRKGEALGDIGHNNKGSLMMHLFIKFMRCTQLSPWIN